MSQLKRKALGIFLPWDFFSRFVLDLFQCKAGLIYASFSRLYAGFMPICFIKLKKTFSLTATKGVCLKCEPRCLMLKCCLALPCAEPHEKKIRKFFKNFLRFPQTRKILKPHLS